MRIYIYVQACVKDRVYRLCDTVRKSGISRELSVPFWNDIHQIEGNYSLYDMKEKKYYIKIRIMENIKNFELLNLSMFTNYISIDRVFSWLLLV